MGAFVFWKRILRYYSWYTSGSDVATRRLRELPVGRDIMGFQVFPG
jgi:hypothetical protein